MAVSLALGVGTLNCYLFSAFPLWQRLWTILNRPLFIVSGVVFLIDAVPQPWRDLLALNPLAHVIAAIRAGVFGGYRPEFVSQGYVYFLSAVLLFLGILLLNRFHRDLVNHGV